MARPVWVAAWARFLQPRRMGIVILGKLEHYRQFNFRRQGVFVN